jgi:hypothetical protein
MSTLQQARALKIEVGNALKSLLRRRGFVLDIVDPLVSCAFLPAPKAILTYSIDACTCEKAADGGFQSNETDFTTKA